MVGAGVVGAGVVGAGVGAAANWTKPTFISECARTTCVCSYGWYPYRQVFTNTPCSLPDGNNSNQCQRRQQRHSRTDCRIEFSLHERIPHHHRMATCSSLGHCFCLQSGAQSPKTTLPFHPSLLWVSMEEKGPSDEAICNPVQTNRVRKTPFSKQA